MRELAPLFRQCYENSLAQHPKLAGSLVVRFEIVADPELGGVVADSQVDPERSRMNSPELSECIQESIYALELPPPEGGGKVVVNYPFRFRSAKSAPAEGAPPPRGSAQ